MSNFVETWKAIAGAMDRSERWCRYMAQRAADPLPVFKVGGIVRLNMSDRDAWLANQRVVTMVRTQVPTTVHVVDDALRIAA